jgi:hypothetical protein
MMIDNPYIYVVEPVCFERFSTLRKRLNDDGEKKM